MELKAKVKAIGERIDEMDQRVWAAMGRMAMRAEASMLDRDMFHYSESELMEAYSKTNRLKNLVLDSIKETREMDDSGEYWMVDLWLEKTYTACMINIRAIKNYAERHLILIDW